jgi:hypothetical protein
LTLPVAGHKATESKHVLNSLKIGVCGLFEKMQSVMFTSMFSQIHNHSPIECYITYIIERLVLLSAVIDMMELKMTKVFGHYPSIFFLKKKHGILETGVLSPSSGKKNTYSVGPNR